MKKGFMLAALAILMVSFVLAQVTYPKITIKVDTDKRILLRFADPVTGEVEEYKPKVENYPGVATTDLITNLPEVNLLVYLKDDDGNIGNPARIGPFPSTEDINLDYRRGLLKETDFSEAEEPADTPAQEQSAEVASTEGSSENQETSKDVVESGFTGNIIGEKISAVPTKYKFSALALLAIIIIAVIMVRKHQQHVILQSIPEEKELEQLSKKELAERKALSRVKTEEELKRKIAEKKRKVSMKLAVEEAKIKELSKEGEEARRREAERVSRRISNNKGSGSFY